MRTGDLHVLMGPNGSGKSSLAMALSGHPNYKAKGEVQFLGNDLLKLTPDERSRKGIFLAFQYPQAISGISLMTLLSESLRARTTKPKKKDATEYPTLAAKEYSEQSAAHASVTTLLEKTITDLALPQDVLSRDVNDGFSGGEKKKAEILQMLALKPKLAILDEPDSGLDIDALKKIASAIKGAQKNGTAILLITHYNRILKYLKPDYVHILYKGKLIQTGGADLARKIEKKGYQELHAHKNT